jgi:hypothetical protein
MYTVLSINYQGELTVNRKKTSNIVLIWLFLVFIATPALGEWTTSISKDEMTGKKSAYAHSDSTNAKKQMKFPYRNVEAWLGVGCNDQKEWAYIGFNESPNLSNTETKDGYSRIRTRVKWNNQLEDIELTQNWGASFIHFRNDERIITKLAESSTFLLELDWYGTGRTYFKFSLRGSSAAIAKIRRVCKIAPSVPTVKIAPSVPPALSLIANVVSPSKIHLTWKILTYNAGVKGYNIYRDGLQLNIPMTRRTHTSATDIGLSASTQYCYTISAYDAEGNESESVVSTQICATTSADW